MASIRQTTLSADPSTRSHRRYPLHIAEIRHVEFENIFQKYGHRIILFSFHENEFLYHTCCVLNSVVKNPDSPNPTV